MEDEGSKRQHQGDDDEQVPEVYTVSCQQPEQSIPYPDNGLILKGDPLILPEAPRIINVLG